MISRLSGCGAWVARILSRSSASGTSVAPTQYGIPSRSQIAAEAPWWSGCAWVSAWAVTVWPSICLRMRLGARLVAASISTSSTR